jgi:predicted nucleic acid-binding Zn ribbon protein
MEPIRSDLRNIVNEIMRAQPPEEAVVLVWPLVCGSEVAARSRAVSFADGILSVEVQDTNWRTQLISFAPRYVAVFAELMGPLVKRVQFQVAGTKRDCQNL